MHRGRRVKLSESDEQLLNVATLEVWESVEKVMRSIGNGVELHVVRDAVFPALGDYDVADPREFNRRLRDEVRKAFEHFTKVVGAA